MRPFIIALFLLFPAVGWAQGMFPEKNESDMAEAGDFQLGGAATRASRVATSPLKSLDVSVPRLSLPLATGLEERSRTERALGAAIFFVSEGLDAGRDALELGTFLRRGQARAGLSVTYLETAAELARSELFVDYALTEQFSVGVSGILDAELGVTEPVRQLGLSAEFETNGGAYVQGGVAGAADYNPVIGLSVGLRF